MHVYACFTWPDESSLDVHIDDELGEYNPIRASELGSLTLDLLRRAVTDREHTQAEHDQP